MHAGGCASITSEALTFSYITVCSQKLIKIVGELYMDIRCEMYTVLII